MYNHIVIIHFKMYSSIYQLSINTQKTFCRNKTFDNLLLHVIYVFCDFIAFGFYQPIENNNIRNSESY